MDESQVEAAVDTFLLASGGVGLIALGLAFKRGRLRRMAGWYFLEGASVVHGHAPFVVLPFGVVCVTVALAAAVLRSAHSTTVIGLGWSLLALAGVFMFCAGLIWIRPPQLLKPAWMVETEQLSTNRPQLGGGVINAVLLLLPVALLVMGGGVVAVSVLSALEMRTPAG